MRRFSAYTTYLLIQGGGRLFFSLIFTVNMIYQATVVGLNPLQLVLVGTVLEATVFVFEIPTGVVADLYSRRLSIIIGYILMGVGFMVEGSIPTFGVVLLSQIIWGLGATFTSGAEEAWIADEHARHQVDDKDSLARLFLRGGQAGSLGALLGIGGSVALASVLGITVPIVLGGGLLICLGIFLFLFMPEQGFQSAPAAEREGWTDLFQTVRQGLALIRASRILMALLLVELIWGMYSEGFDRLWTPHLLDNFTFPTFAGWEPVVWFGIIDAVGLVLGIAAAQLAHRWMKNDGDEALQRGVQWGYGVVAVSVLGLAWSQSFWWAIVFLWCARLARTIAGPLFAAWVNRHLESSVRATVLSTLGQSNALGQIAGGPVIGAVGTLFNLRVALTLGGVILSGTLPLLNQTKQETRKEKNHVTR